MRRQLSPNVVVATTTAPPGMLLHRAAPSCVTRGVRVVFCPQRRQSHWWSHHHPRRLRQRWRQRRRSDHDPTPAPPRPGVGSSDYCHGGHLPPHVIIVIVVIAVVVLAVSISLIAAPADDGAELFVVVGIQLIRHAPDNTIISVGRIVVVVGQHRLGSGSQGNKSRLHQPLPP